MNSYEILRLVLGPIVRPMTAAVGRLRLQQTVRRFGEIGTGVVFAGEPTIIGGERIALGTDCRVMRGVTLWATPRGRISVGPRSYLGDYTFLVSDAGIEIGSDVLIAPFCYVQDSDHGFTSVDMPIREQPSTSSPIRVGDDVWIGAHSVITRGVTIGRGAVVGANSVVTHDIEAYTVVAGSPARPIRSRRGPRA